MSYSCSQPTNTPSGRLQCAARTDRTGYRFLHAGQGAAPEPVRSAGAPCTPHVVTGCACPLVGCGTWDTVIFRCDGHNYFLVLRRSRDTGCWTPFTHGRLTIYRTSLRLIFWTCLTTITCWIDHGKLSALCSSLNVADAPIAERTSTINRTGELGEVVHFCSKTRKVCNACKVLFVWF